MRHIVLFACAFALAAALAGCGQGDGGPPVSAQDQQSTTQIGNAARQAGGKWENLTPDQQKLFLDRTHGNLTEAKNLASVAGRVPPTR